MIANLRFHCRGNAQRFVDAPEVERAEAPIDPEPDHRGNRFARVSCCVNGTGDGTHQRKLSKKPKNFDAEEKGSYVPPAVR